LGGVTLGIQIKGFSRDSMHGRTNSEEVWLRVVQGSADAAGFASVFVLCRLSFAIFIEVKLIA
jgi:hypothetical protein